MQRTRKRTRTPRNHRADERMDERSSERKSKCLTGGYVVDTYKRSRVESLWKGAWTFPSCVGETASGHGRPCGRCDKAILLFFRLACRDPFWCHIEVCASGIWSLDGGPLYGNLLLPKRCVRFKTCSPSHGCECKRTAVKLTLHSTISL
jgi:hypothetical protein